MPHSSPEGKAEALAWIGLHVRRDEPILDVGPGAGWWGRELFANGWRSVDAVEVWAPYIQQFRLQDIYRHVFVADIRCFDLRGRSYGLAILGDVLEHLDLHDATTVLRRFPPATRLLVSVPWNYPQGPVGGNPYECHLQPDLCPATVVMRYPTLHPIFIGPTMGIYAREEHP